MKEVDAFEKFMADWQKQIDERDAKLPKLNQPDDPIAPDGMVWVCHACGKTTGNRYGEEAGWDESCMLNSALYAKDKLVFDGRRVTRIKDVDQVP